MAFGMDLSVTLRRLVVLGKPFSQTNKTINVTLPTSRPFFDDSMLGTLVYDERRETDLSRHTVTALTSTVCVESMQTRTHKIYLA